MKKIFNYITIVLLISVVALSLNNIIIEGQKTNVEVFFVKLNKKNSQVTMPVERKVFKDNLVKNTVEELLKGPNQAEISMGLSTEIPTDTKLLVVHELTDKIIVDLSEDFEYGGGSGSMAVRVAQLTDTLCALVKKPIYLYIQGEQVEALGGEGVYIKQPLNSLDSQEIDKAE